MRASIRDMNALREVKLDDVAAYLVSRHWKAAETREGRYSIWINEARDQEIEIFLPARRDTKDYATRMAEILGALEVAEGRSQLNIWVDIANVSSDVLRIRAENDSFQDGTMPIERGVALVQHASALVMSAACGAAQPREVLPSRKPTQAIDYVKNVRLGQTEQGSYVLTVRMPVPSPRSTGMQYELIPNQSGPTLDPFERKVSTTLMQAVGAVHDSAHRYAESGDLKPLLRHVRLGVSANLCEALVGLHEETGSRQIRLQMSWAPTLPISDDRSSEFAFRGMDIPVLREASRLLRESAPRGEFRLIGPVVALRRNPMSFSGKVTVEALVDGAPRRVTLGLGAANYEQAIEAHQRNLQVRCWGELVKDGNHYALHGVERFEIEDDARD